MNLLTSIWRNVWGLFVDDGWIASGTVAALVATGVWSALAGSTQELRNLGGPLLFALLMLLLLANLYAAGQRALRKRLRE